MNKTDINNMQAQIFKKNMERHQKQKQIIDYINNLYLISDNKKEKELDDLTDFIFEYIKDYTSLN